MSSAVTSGPWSSISTPSRSRNTPRARPAPACHRSVSASIVLALFCPLPLGPCPLPCPAPLLERDGPLRPGGKQLAHAFHQRRLLHRGAVAHHRHLLRPRQVAQ